MFLLMLEQQLQKGTLPKDYKIQVHKLEYHEKGYYFFVTHFRKWNPYII